MLKKTVKKLRGGIKKKHSSVCRGKEWDQNNTKQINAQRIAKGKHYCIRTNWKSFLRGSRYLAPGAWGLKIHRPFRKQCKCKRHGSIFSKWAFGGSLPSVIWLPLSLCYEINSHLLAITIHQKMPTMTLEIFVLGTVCAVRVKGDRCGFLKYNLCLTLSEIREDI